MQARRNEEKDADVQYIKTVILLLLLIIIIPVSVSAQTADDEAGKSLDEGSAEAEQTSFFEDFAVSIDARLEANLIGLMPPIPGIPFIIGVPMSLSPETVTITPQFGFVYYFDVMTVVHNEFYVPIGLSAVYNPISIGLDFMFYPAVGGRASNNLMSLSAVSEVELFSKDKFSLLLGLKFGSMFILDPAENMAMIMLDAALIPRYKL